MPNLSYREFLALVAKAVGPFSYTCLGHRGVCHPVLYLARNWAGGLPKGVA